MRKSNSNITSKEARRGEEMLRRRARGRQTNWEVYGINYGECPSDEEDLCV